MTSIWLQKPWWCQPWSIVLTGIGVILGSWLALHRWWISLPIAVAVALWWWIFLILVPISYQSGGLDQVSDSGGPEP